MTGGFFEPMLASPWRGKEAFEAGEWAAEEKYDGHRLVVEVTDEPDGLFDSRTVRAWSRYGERRILPARVREALATFPSGLFDGELVLPGGKSWDVTALASAASLEYVVFDCVRIEGAGDLAGRAYSDRRLLLEAGLGATGNQGMLAGSTLLRDPVDVHVQALRDAVWAVGGEGLVLKRLGSAYRPGKRSKDWLKVKRFKTAAMTVVGFREGLSGPFSVVLLEDDAGGTAAVKVLNDKERAALADDPAGHVGRRLVVEHQGMTPDGRYRHPMWDRWAEEGE